MHAGQVEAAAAGPAARIAAASPAGSSLEAASLQLYNMLLRRCWLVCWVARQGSG